MALLPVLADRVPAVVSDMIPQHVSNVIWATGQLSADPRSAAMSQGLRDMLSGVVARAAVLLPTATPQNIANTCRGLALSNHQDAAFLEAVAKKVAQEAPGWPPAGAEKDLPEVLFAFARLKATGHDDMLKVAAKKLSPMAGKINAWGLCATLWAYQQLDTSNDFPALQQRLDSELAPRRLTHEDVQRSRLGPEAWTMDVKKPKRRQSV